MGVNEMCEGEKNCLEKQKVGRCWDKNYLEQSGHGSKGILYKEE